MSARSIKLPQSAGVYLMKDAAGRILYVGKAGNLRRRVESYFGRPRHSRTEALLTRTAKIDHQKTGTAIEALILESRLIKKYQPPYNVREKDDKSFLWVKITKEKWPRVLLVRGEGDFGPFTSAGQIRQALKILRRIFPYGLHQPPPSHIARSSNIIQRRPCLDYELGLCPGTCVGAADHSNVLKNIRMFRAFFKGRKKQIIQSLTGEMNQAAQKMAFEEAERIKRQIFALKHIEDTALIGAPELKNKNYRSNIRIEGYDISNISGASAAGAMAVFAGDRPAKNEYRKFKIRNFITPNDLGMLQEMLRRRLRHREWPLPDLILIDGGAGQVSAAKIILNEFGLKIPIIGIAKGPQRKKNQFIGQKPRNLNSQTLIKVRDEAHRFALSYHQKLRHKFSTAKPLASVRSVL